MVVAAGAAIEKVRISSNRPQETASVYHRRTLAAAGIEVVHILQFPQRQAAASLPHLLVSWLHSTLAPTSPLCPLDRGESLFPRDHCAVAGHSFIATADVGSFICCFSIT